MQDGSIASSLNRDELRAAVFHLIKVLIALAGAEGDALRTGSVPTPDRAEKREATVAHCDYLRRCPSQDEDIARVGLAVALAPPLRALSEDASPIDEEQDADGRFTQALDLAREQCSVDAETARGMDAALRLIPHESSGIPPGKSLAQPLGGPEGAAGLPPGDGRHCDKVRTARERPESVALGSRPVPVVPLSISQLTAHSTIGLPPSTYLAACRRYAAYLRPAKVGKLIVTLTSTWNALFNDLASRRASAGPLGASEMTGDTPEASEVDAVLRDVGLQRKPRKDGTR